MNRTIFAAVCLLISASAAGQEIAAPPAPLAKGEAIQGGFVIEFKIVQGRRLLDNRHIPRSVMIAGFGASLRDEKAESDANQDADSTSKEASPDLDESARMLDLWNLDEDCPDVTTLAAPTLGTIENRPAFFWVHNKSSFSYLVPAGDDLFRVQKTPPHDLGVKVEFTVKTIPGEPGAVELSPLKVSQTTLDGREPVAGLELDVGRPIISKRSVETTTKCVLGAPRCLPITTIPERQVLLLIRVKRASQ